MVVHNLCGGVWHAWPRATSTPPVSAGALPAKDPATRPMSRACTEREAGNGLCVVDHDGLAFKELSTRPWWIVSKSDLGGRARRRISTSEDLGAWWLDGGQPSVTGGRRRRLGTNEEGKEDREASVMCTWLVGDI